MTTLFLVARGDETTTGVGGGMVMHRELFYLGGVHSTATISGELMSELAVKYM